MFQLACAHSRINYTDRSRVSRMPKTMHTITIKFRSNLGRLALLMFMEGN